MCENKGKRIKILIFLKYLAGGGAERVMINIMNHLDKTRFQIVLVVGNGQTNDYPDYIDNNITKISYRSHRARHSFLKLRRTIIQEKPDLIFTTTYAANAVVSLVNATLGKRVPLIVREANHRSESKDATKLNKVITWISYNFLSDIVVAISEGVREDLIHSFHINSKKIRTIYNLVDIKLINKLKKEKGDNLPDNDIKKIIATGRLVDQKDYPTLLKAFQIVTLQCNAKLIILGKGPLEQELKKLSKDLGIEEKIEFKGFVSNPFKYMHNGDIFILTSKFEGFANVIAEALACGVPVVSTDCKAGPREILKNGLYGRLAPVGDYQKIAEEILSVLGSDNKEVIAKGLERAQDFDADRMISEYEDLFLELTKKR